MIFFLQEFHHVLTRAQTVKAGKHLVIVRMPPTRFTCRKIVVPHAPLKSLEIYYILSLNTQQTKYILNICYLYDIVDK